MNLRETKNVEINGTKYLITALEADYGLEVMMRLTDIPSASLLRDVILRSVTVNNIQPTEDWFKRHYARNYSEAMELFQKITEFNFGEDSSEGGDSPNGEGGTSET